VAVSSLTLVLVACGEDADEGIEPAPGPQLSAPEYFERLRGAFNGLEQAIVRSTEAQDPESIDTLTEVLPFLKAAITDLEEAVPVFINEVAALNPPSEAADAHARFLSGIRLDNESISQLADRVRDANTLSEATSAFENRKTTLVESREPCRQLQEIAQAQDVKITLPCDE